MLFNYVSRRKNDLRQYTAMMIILVVCCARGCSSKKKIKFYLKVKFVVYLTPVAESNYIKSYDLFIRRRIDETK